MQTRTSIGIRAWPAVAVLLAAFAGPAAPQTDAAAGRFIAVTGDVRILGTDGVARRAARDEVIRQGESIVTGANSLAQLRMTDGGAISLRADSQMKLDRYQFAGTEDREASFFASIVKGGLRTISGLIGRTRRDAYRVTTPSATMGIRGTHFEVVHVVQPLPDAPAGTYGRVYDGSIALTNKAGVSLLVGRDQTAFVALPGNLAPVLRPAPPAIFGRPTPVPLPPQSRVDDEKKAGVPSPAHKDGTRAVAPGAAREVAPGTVRELAPGTVRELAPATTVAPTRSLSTPLLNPIDTPRVMEVAPTTTTISPTLTSPTLISPTTTIQTAPATISPTLVSPATTVSPTTTIQTSPTISPTLISPTTTIQTAPTTTISPTTTIQTAPTISPTLIAPIQTAPATTIQTAPTVIQTAPTVIQTAPTTIQSIPSTTTIKR